MTNRTVLVETSRSPFAKLRPVPLNAVTLRDSFWAPKRKNNTQITLPSQYDLLKSTGRIGNFHRAAGWVDQPFQGRVYDDSDVYKWFEAVCWTLATDPNPELKELGDKVIEAIVAAQQPNGSNSYFMYERAGERWQNLRDLHELYCAGHLIQATIAHHRPTGADNLLAVALKLADHICDWFGPEETEKQAGTSGHPGIEMALIELARSTGNERYLHQAAYFIEARGHGLVGGNPYHQDHQPFRELGRFVGHAVRALYLAAGVTDLYAETGEAPLRSTLSRLWDVMATRQSYITGGVSARATGEAFGGDYELPNRTAYAESCAAIGNLMWNWRLLQLEGKPEYGDMLETILYNAALVGRGADGRSYFYRNSLEDDGHHRRQPWFACACCPPNLARLLATLPGYFYNVSPEGVWIHLYGSNTAKIDLVGGQTITVIQRTSYPWECDVNLEIQALGEFDIFLRIPTWCLDGPTLEINGESLTDDVQPGTYHRLSRHWKPGDKIDLRIPMHVTLVESHPMVTTNQGQVALTRGPLVYCLEGVDHPNVDLCTLKINPIASIDVEMKDDLLGGIAVLKGRGFTFPWQESWGQTLYRRFEDCRAKATGEEVDWVAIPYFVGGNRTPGQLQIWIHY